MTLNTVLANQIYYAPKICLILSILTVILKHGEVIKTMLPDRIEDKFEKYYTYSKT